jgi:hypothetical protein
MTTQVKPTTLQGDLRNLPAALEPLTKLPNWVCWNWEWKIDKKGAGGWTKVPYRPDDPSQPAKTNSPKTWGAYEQALSAFEAGHCDGIGICLLNIDYAAFDLDKCRDPMIETIEEQAMAIVNRSGSYCEITPSGTGLRVIGVATGAKVHRKQQIIGTVMAVETYRKATRYITISGNPLPGMDVALAGIDAVIDAVVAELDADPGDDTTDDDTAGNDDLPDGLIKLIDQEPEPAADLSAEFHHAVCWLGDLGWPAKRIEARIVSKPIVPERYGKRLMDEILRCLDKRAGKGVTYDDFYAYMPRHQYIYAPTGEMWPAASINSRLVSKPVKKKDGTPALDGTGKPRYRKPNAWLDKNRPVEQMTWAPGEPQAIANKLITEGGWIERSDVATFNLYRPPVVRPGNAANAGRWLELGERIYPKDFERLVMFGAHRVQHPEIKVNHGKLLGGSTGIGKDTLLEPLKHGVGPWNFKEVSPQDIMGIYNDYMRSVIVRISEARDLGEFNRYTFHNRMKTISAAPPDVVRVNSKYIPHHHVPNCQRPAESPQFGACNFPHFGGGGDQPVE